MEYFERSSRSRVPYLGTAQTRLPDDATSFHAYPASEGWKLHHDYKLEAHGSRTPSQDLAPFLQSWLFFGLVSAVVQKQGRPLLKTVSLRGKRFLYTRTLANAIRAWVTWEQMDPREREVRQVKAGYILSTARQVVRRNCGLDISTKGVGYSTSKGHPRYVPDQLALLLMVLGETLSTAFTQIMDDTTARTTLLNEGLGDGWGSPRWVLTQMEKDGWCPHDIRLIHSRLGSHATTLLSACMNSKESSSAVVQHEICTEEGCRSAEAARLGGLRCRSCLPNCKNAYNGGCEMAGPDMGSVTEILGSSTLDSQTRKWASFPLLRFRPKIPDDPESIDMEVRRFETNSLPAEEFATISHVWSDGLNNLHGNKIPLCRLRQLKHIMREINHGRDIYFWIDCLIVPGHGYDEKRRGRQVRTTAISQIKQIYHQATYTVVLDEALPTSPDGRSPELIAKAHLSWAWLGRLWTLLDSCPNAEPSNDENTPNLAEMRSQLHRLLSSHLDTLIRGQIGGGSANDRNTFGRGLELRNDFGTRTCTTVVVDAWKVARWRTSSLVVHHTLVLAALLSIDSRQPRHNAATMSTVENGIHSQELMATFWKEIQDIFPGSIPANIIFLPGEKLRADNHPGFGWAPKVLAKIDEMERSELLRARQEYTDLIPNEGLLVKFPGILLRLSSQYLRRQILGMDEPRAFYLPLQAKGIRQWMSVASTTHARDTDFLSEVAQRLSQLAIIVPHEIIPESPPIIALLVEIYEETCTEKYAEHLSSSLRVTYKCQIIRQIRVRRESAFVDFDGEGIFQLPTAASGSLVDMTAISASSLPSRGDESREFGGEICFGEWTTCEQKWTIDGFQSSRSITFPQSGASSLNDRNQDTKRFNTSNTGLRKDVNNRTNKTLDASINSQSPASPIKKARSYWRNLTGNKTIRPPVKEPHTPDPEPRLIDVTLLGTSLARPNFHYFDMMSVEAEYQSSSTLSSSQTILPFLGSRPQVIITSSVLLSPYSSGFFADAVEPTVQDIITSLSTHLLVRRRVKSSIQGAITKSLNKLIHFYGVVLWYSAYEAWESQLALLVEKNSQQIWDGVLHQMNSETPPVDVQQEFFPVQSDRVLQADPTSPSQPEQHIIRFLIKGLAFEDLLNGLEYIVSEQHLSLALHIQDEGAVQEWMLANADNAVQVDLSGKSPMDVATSRVTFLRGLGCSESAMLKSLRMIQRLQPIWPLSKSHMFHSIPPAIVDATLTRSFDLGTDFAPVPEDDDNFWDVITAVTALLPKQSPPDMQAGSQLYSWEVLDLLSAIDSSKTHGDDSPEEKSQPWSPQRIFSELAATVTITGSADTFELRACSELLRELWGDVGLDALRLIAAGAFLSMMSRKACHDQRRALSISELNDYVINNLRSQSSMDSQQQQARKSAEEMVLDELFGGKGDNILSSKGRKSMFSLSTTSKKVLLLRYPSKNVALLEALAWACAALRPNSSGSPRLIKNSTRRSQGSFYTLRGNGRVRLTKLLIWDLKPMENMSLDDLGSPHCWTALFAPGLVVPLPRLDRWWGKGLGMSFEMMVHLSASQSYIWVDDGPWLRGTFPYDEDDTNERAQSGGYVLGGYRTALVPISRSHDGTQIQWHLETSQEPNTIMDHTNLQSVKGDWLRVKNVSEFNGTKCYIGWYEKADVLLGTKNLSQIPTWSGTDRHHKSLHPASLNLNAAIGLGSAASSPLSAQLTFGTTFNFVSNVQTYEPSKDYNDAIRNERGKTALVVDYAQKRAYLVPKLSLVLHLCRMEALRSQRTLSSNHRASRVIPAAEPSDDGYEAALKVLQENEEAVFIGSETTADKTTLRQLFLQVHFELVKAAGFRESPRRVTLNGSKVYATEVRGVLERPDTGTPLSIIQDPGILAWVRLAALADAVCICSNLGTAIRPVAVGNVPDCECYELPHDKYFLAAHMRCLQDILERQCCAISELNLRGKLDFGEGYIMRLSGRRLWTQGRHHNHGRFWENRAEVIQSIHKEDGVDGKVRKLLGTAVKAGQREGEDPALTGVMVFGTRR